MLNENGIVDVSIVLIHRVQQFQERKLAPDSDMQVDPIMTDYCRYTVMLPRPQEGFAIRGLQNFRLCRSVGKTDIAGAKSSRCCYPYWPR